MSVSVMLEQEQSIGPSPLSEEQLSDLRPLTELADEDLVVAHLDGRPGAFQHLRTTHYCARPLRRSSLR